MKTEKSKFLVQGILFLIFGALFFMFPVIKTVLFSNIVGFTLVITGVIAVFDAIFRTKGLKFKLFRLLEGLLWGTFGFVFFLRDPLRGAVILIYIVIWGLIFMSMMSTTLILQSTSGFKWIAVFFNLMVIWFGIQSLFDPKRAGVIFYWTVGLQLIFTGVNRIMLYFVLPEIVDEEN